jgi:hypothetical protein
VHPQALAWWLQSLQSAAAIEIPGFGQVEPVGVGVVAKAMSKRSLTPISFVIA